MVSGMGVASVQAIQSRVTMCATASRELSGSVRCLLGAVRSTGQCKSPQSINRLPYQVEYPEP